MTALFTSERMTPEPLALQEVPCCVCAGRRFLKTASSADDIYLKPLEMGIRKSFWVICKDCGLVMQNPRITQEAADLLYAEHKYREGENAEEVVDVRIRRVEERLRWIEDQGALPLAKGAPPKILDIGCGLGASLHVLKKRGWEVYGVEPDSAWAKFGNKRFGFQIKEEFFTENTFPGLRVDLIYTNHAFEHFLEPLPVLQAAAKTLSSTGRLFICVPTFRGCWRHHAWQWMNVAHIHMFTAISLANLLAKAGLKLYRWRYPPTGELWALTGHPLKPWVETPRWKREPPWRIQAEIYLQPLAFFFYLMVNGMRKFLRNPGRIARRALEILRDSSQRKHLSRYLE